MQILPKNIHRDTPRKANSIQVIRKKILPEQNRETFPMKMIMFHNLARIQVISKETPSFRNP